MFGDRGAKKFVESHAVYYQKHPEVLKKFQSNTKWAQIIIAPLFIISVLFIYPFLGRTFGTDRMMIVFGVLLLVIIIIALFMKRGVEKKMRE